MNFFERTTTLSLEIYILILDFRALLVLQCGSKLKRQDDKRDSKSSMLYTKKKLDDLDSKLDRLG